MVRRSVPPFVRPIVHLFVHLVLAASLLTTAAASAAPARVSCPDDGDAWADACFESFLGGQRVKPRHLKKITFDRDGHATLMTQSDGLVAVNRRGRVILTHIAFAGDFDFHDAEAGINRYAVRGPGGKTTCGYFQMRGFRVVIPATYDECRAFRDGSAEVCIGCTTDCGDDPDCHVIEFVGGEGLVLDAGNRILERYALPALPTCPHGKTRTQSTPSGECRPGVSFDAMPVEKGSLFR